MMQSPAEKELKQVLRHYDLGRLQNAQQLERGYVNENWIINTTGGRFFLKHRYPCLRSPRLIHAQHALTEHLRQSGFPAPEILATKSGDTLLMLDERFYEIQIYIEGWPYQLNRYQHFQAAAAMLGRYHLSVDGFSNQAFSEQGKLYCPQVLNENLTNLMKEWKTCGDSRVIKIFHRIKSNASELRERFARHPNLPEIVIHGDYHAGNLIFQNDRIVGVVDYDKSSWQPRVAELAEALIFFSSTTEGSFKHLVYPSLLSLDKFSNFLLSYASAFSLPVGDFRRQDHLFRFEAGKIATRAGAETFPRASELIALPDYMRCIWLSLSLRGLSERGPFLTEFSKALNEVLTLGDWAARNRQRIIETAYTALGKKSDFCD
jgi:homoserine kinase type II